MVLAILYMEGVVRKGTTNHPIVRVQYDPKECSYESLFDLFWSKHDPTALNRQKNLIKPGHSLKGPRGTTELLFHCIRCDHKSEMFGFVKDVFVFCTKSWGLETLIKELSGYNFLLKEICFFLLKELITDGEGADRDLRLLMEATKDILFS